MAQLGVWDVLRDEINSAFEQDRAIVHVRVTASAIPGSIAAMPISPEHARAVAALWILRDGTVTDLYHGRALEVLLHPMDYETILKDIEAALRGDCLIGDPVLLLGLPVMR